ncbi:MAG TPA: MFS transporter [SAR202 cluster bacterium]|nr:MFS transporter [SAR202 cluster bacterium]
MISSLRKIHYSWVVLAAVCGLAFSNSVASLNVLTVFFLPMSDEFLWNRTQISGAASLGALLGAGVAVVTGRILDQTGPRVILAIGALITTISMIALSQISAIIAFYIFYGAARVSDQGFIQAVSPSIIAKWFDRNSGMAVSVLFAVTALGGVLLPLISQASIEEFGWRFGWLVLGLLMFLVGALPVILFVRSPTDLHENDSDEVESGNFTFPEFSLSEVLHTKEYWFLTTTVFATGIATAGIGLHIVPFLVGQGLNPEEAVATVSVRFIASAIGGLIGGVLADRYTPRLLILTAISVRAFSIALLIFADTFFKAVFSGALGGISDGIQSTVLVLLLVSYFGKNNVGGIYGVNRAAAVLGFSAGPMIAGIGFDVTGSYNYIFCGFLLLTILSIGLVFSANRTFPAVR